MRRTAATSANMALASLALPVAVMKTPMLYMLFAVTKGLGLRVYLVFRSDLKKDFFPWTPCQGLDLRIGGGWGRILWSVLELSQTLAGKLAINWLPPLKIGLNAPLKIGLDPILGFRV